MLSEKPPTCDGQSFPRRIERRLARAFHLIDRAEAATDPKKARRKVQALERLLGNTANSVVRVGKHGHLTSDCAAGFAAVLTDGRQRAVDLATTF